MATLDHRHLPPYLTDRLLAGVLPPEVAAAVSRQERTCDDCRERLDQARRAMEAYLSRHPPERRARELLGLASDGRARRRALGWVLPVVSAATAVALFVLTRGELRPVAPERSSEGMVAKGGDPSLSFTVHRPGSPGPRPGRSGEALRPGDTVELHLRAGRFRGAHVFSVDDSGQPEPLFAWSPGGAGAPPAMVLGAAPEPERIVVLFHDLPDPATELPRLREAIARTYTGPGARGVEAEAESKANIRPPDGREIVTGSILIRKETTAAAKP
jgi:hypothetical protein